MTQKRSFRFLLVGPKQWRIITQDEHRSCNAITGNTDVIAVRGVTAQQTAKAHGCSVIVRAKTLAVTPHKCGGVDNG